MTSNPIPEALINTTNTPKTATYTITPTSSAGCIGSPFTLTVTVNPTPSVTTPNPLTDVICSDSTFTVTPNFSNGIVPIGTTYSWAAPGGTQFTGGAAGSGTNINGTLINLTNSSKTATYTVTPTSSLGCIGSNFTLIVTINPTPAITTTNLNPSPCSGIPFSVSPTNIINGIVPTNTTYSWPAPQGSGFIGGTSGSGATTINGTLTNTTSTIQYATYTITPKSGGCQGLPFTITVTLYPAPVISAMTDSVCSGDQFTVSPLDGINGIVPAGTTYSWSAPTLPSTLTGGAAGSGTSITGTLTNLTNIPQIATYTVTPKSGNCTGPTFTLMVTVFPVPAITTIHDTVCSGNPFTVSPANITNGNVPAGTTYSWSAPSLPNTLTGGAAGSGTSITGTLTNSISIPQTATYTVTPTSVFGCTGSTFIVMVNVNPAPVITAMTDTAVCSGVHFTVTPVNITNGIVPAGTTYSWPIPIFSSPLLTGGASGSGAPNINGTIINPTSTPQTATYTVTPASGVGCIGNTFTVTVTIDPTPAVNSSPTGTVCSGVAHNYNITSTVTGSTYSWSRAVVTGISNLAVTNQTSNPITEALNNMTALPVNVIYLITPTASGCSGSQFTYTVTVTPATYGKQCLNRNNMQRFSREL